MKRIILAAAFALLSLAGCAGIDTGAIVSVAEAVTDENTSTAKGVTAGMSSSDAANVLRNRDYYNAVKAVAGAGKGDRSPLVEIEAHDGKAITIDAKSFKVYAPPANTSAGIALRAPENIESNGIKWFREGKDALIGLAQTVLPWKLVREEGKTRRHESDNGRDVRLGELDVMSDAVTGSQTLGSQAITTFKPAVPIIIAAPAAAVPAATVPATE